MSTAGLSVVRATALDVVPERPMALAAVVTGHAVDTISGQPAPIRELELRAVLDDEARLISLDGSVELPGDLVGRVVGRGFRASLQPLLDGGPTGRLLRRLLWDLPIVAQVAGQTALLDHDAARADMQLSRRGTDQCSGWRADGQMMQQIDANAGVLVMPLGPTRDRSIAEPWLTASAPLPPMATRRSRVIEIGPLGTGVAALPVRVTFRDSYADPDGVQRALHEWVVTTELRRSTGEARFGEFATDAGRLPWVECPVAGMSATRLNGHAPADIERVVGQDFAGISTCTHLNDTLRTLAELPDLVASLDPAV
jgi:hypothetical protein